MQEVNEGARIITELVDPQAKIIFGAVFDENLRKGEIKTTVIATGFSSVPKIKDPKKKKNPQEILERKITEEEENKEENDWDIPAFLRKRNK